ncbi:MAG: hypothetical protein CM1200mP30_15850 [Pseudomonadota bacterium]|nr:MAG: hypothetical protein CM1200mP30_15850 [Pseudomonadota bacterium]
MSNVSPYTRVIAECLHSLSEDKPDDCACDTKQVMQLLINMLKGENAGAYKRACEQLLQN